MKLNIFNKINTKWKDLAEGIAGTFVALLPLEGVRLLLSLAMSGNVRKNNS